ncbi:MAG TPA: hypothetical protein VL306_02425 [Methylomirabilota bacterium]|nr:hypothetical protein [Methylomirabilota bacterium]
MQKYIAVVNPKMDDDQISKLIAQDIAGAIFSISHQNYPLAAKLIHQVKKLSRKHNRPISLIQDATDMLDPLDLEFGMRNGIDWVVLADPKYVKDAWKLNKKIPIIWKGKNIPKNVKVDSLMTESIADPDAVVEGWGQIKHQISPHVKQKVLESIKHISDHAAASAIAVSDLEHAKTLSAMRPKQKIVYAPKNPEQAAKASIYWGVHPMFSHNNLHSHLKNRQLLKAGERYLDARNVKHVSINLVS